MWFVQYEAMKDGINKESVVKIQNAGSQLHKSILYSM